MVEVTLGEKLMVAEGIESVAVWNSLPIIKQEENVPLLRKEKLMSRLWKKLINHSLGGWKFTPHNT